MICLGLILSGVAVLIGLVGLIVAINLERGNNND